MIGAKEQTSLFTDIARVLPKKINIFAIGGTAMIFYGLKGLTKDIDLVFTNQEDRKVFKETALSIGYEEGDVRIVYGKKDNTPEMINLGEARIDLFLLKIITSHFSESMQKRAVQIHEFDRNLIIKTADIHDVLIMKSVTSRDKDREDIVSILKNSEINWDTILIEAEEQVRLGNEKAILSLGYLLEDINNTREANIPKSVLNKLWSLLRKQVDRKAKSAKKLRKK